MGFSAEGIQLMDGVLGAGGFSGIHFLVMLFSLGSGTRRHGAFIDLSAYT